MRICLNETHRDVVLGVDVGGETAPGRYMEGENDMWPWYKAAAGSLVQVLIGSALLEIQDYNVRSVLHSFAAT